MYGKFSALFVFAGALSIYAQSVVQVHAGQNISNLVNENPPGTTFHLNAGVYRMQFVVPLDGDVFEGDTATVLNGSALLTKWTQNGATWVASGQTQKAGISGTCKTDHPMCDYSEDVFYDGRPLIRASSGAGLKSGQWFFDYANQAIIIANDPAGHTVETTMKSWAFSGSATNVVIKNLTVEKYAAPSQTGAIGGQYPGQNWTISNVEVRLNHGAGVKLASGSTLSGSFIHDNGQEGVSGNGTNIQIVGNQISHGNYAGFDPGWEAGGAKCTVCTNVLFRNNYVHDNDGGGLWTDGGSAGITFDSNVVEQNTGGGISHEIGGNAVIENNTLSGNGRGLTVWLWGAQISIQNSHDVEVKNNTVIVPATFGNGIAIIYQNRPASNGDAHLSTNNYVHDNDITYLGANQGRSGFVADYNQTVAYSWPNKFDHNTYHAPSNSVYLWDWNGLILNWQGFRAQNMERNGSLESTTLYTVETKGSFSVQATRAR